jgi:hypothetical protein
MRVRTQLTPTGEASAPSLFGACLSRFSGYWWTATSINVEMIGTDLVVPQMLD